MKIAKILIALLILCQSLHAEKLITVFGMNPQITVLLEILYPQGMIGLNYTPYQEDLLYMPENVKNLPILGGMMTGGNEVSFEKIIALKPDLIVFPHNTPHEAIQKYRKFNIRTITVNVSELENIQESISVLGKELNIQNRANKLQQFIEKSQEKLKHLTQKVTNRPKVYFALGFNGLQTQCQKKDAKNDLAFKIGGENIIKCDEFSNPNQRLQTNFENLLLKDPDIIFVREIALYNEIMNNPKYTWQKLQAIKNKKVYYAPSSPSNWLTRPVSIMQSIGLLWAFSKTQPHILEASEVKHIAQEFYENFLRKLNDDDYNKLLQEE